jgi:RNase P subunit RPR2
LTFLQRLITRLAPSRAAAIERESREWVVTCPNCGRSASIWELGGIRYKAASKGKRILARCSGCGKRAMAPVERRQADSDNPENAQVP